MSGIPNQNAYLLSDFAAYCEAHPEQRFWQALAAWAGVRAVMVRRYRYSPMDGRCLWGSIEAVDTFYWEGKDN